MEGGKAYITFIINRTETAMTKPDKGSAQNYTVRIAHKAEMMNVGVRNWSEHLYKWVDNQL